MECKDSVLEVPKVTRTFSQVQSHLPKSYSNAASATNPTINEPPKNLALLVAPFFVPSSSAAAEPELPDPPDDEPPEELEPPELLDDPPEDDDESAEKEIPAAVHPSMKAATQLPSVL